MDPVKHLTIFIQCIHIQHKITFQQLQFIKFYDKSAFALDLLRAAFLDKTCTAVIMGVILPVDPHCKLCLMNLLCRSKCIFYPHIFSGLKHTLPVSFPVKQLDSGKKQLS